MLLACLPCNNVGICRMPLWSTRVDCCPSGLGANNNMSPVLQQVMYTQRALLEGSCVCPKSHLHLVCLVLEQLAFRRRSSAEICNLLLSGMGVDCCPSDACPNKSMWIEVYQTFSQQAGLEWCLSPKDHLQPEYFLAKEIMHPNLQVVVQTRSLPKEPCLRMIFVMSQV